MTADEIARLRGQPPCSCADATTFNEHGECDCEAALFAYREQRRMLLAELERLQAAECAVARVKAECRYAVCQWCRLVIDYRDGEHHLGSKRFPCAARGIREMEE